MITVMNSRSAGRINSMSPVVMVMMKIDRSQLCVNHKGLSNQISSGTITTALSYMVWAVRYVCVLSCVCLPLLHYVCLTSGGMKGKAKADKIYNHPGPCSLHYT